jgi:serine O-acetyltransferase
MTAKRDPIWQAIREQVAAAIEKEPLLASPLHTTVLGHETLEDSFSYHLATMLGGPTINTMTLREVIQEAYAADRSIGKALREDLSAVVERDPAGRDYSIPFLYFKGFHALESHRVAHWLWGQGREGLAYYLQHRMSQIFAVDIHPAARLGKGILIDHATAVVIGETAVVGDYVSLLHEVTLGGTGKESGDRHPKIGRGVLIGAGAKVLGNIQVGEGSKIAAGSLVLRDVPPHTTVAGVPARVIGRIKTKSPAREMDQCIAPAENGEEGKPKDA